jgi:hypothetical protein
MCTLGLSEPVIDENAEAVQRSTLGQAAPAVGRKRNAPPLRLRRERENTA